MEAMMQKKQSGWTEGKTLLYRGYQVIRSRDGKSLEVHKGSSKGGGQLIQKLPEPVTSRDVVAFIDKLHTATP
jgi:hypothetical protein